MKQKVKVRPIAKDDNQKIYRIIQSSLEKYNLDKPGTAYFDPYLNQLYEFYQNEARGEYWILEKDNAIIDGSLLFKTTENYARTQHYKKLYIETIDVLKQANVIYKHYGFESLSEPLSGSEHGLMNSWLIKEL